MVGGRWLLCIIDMIVIIIMHGHSLWLVDEGNKIELNSIEIVSPAVKDNLYQKYERCATYPKAHKPMNIQ